LIPIKETHPRGLQRYCSSMGRIFMIGFLGAHFEMLVLVAFGAFTVALGLTSIIDAVKREQ